MTTADVQQLGLELGLDVVGVALAEPYVETERHIRERRERGLFGRLGFTTSRPEVSCHPEKRLDGEARSVVSAALCYYAPEPEQEPGQGRLPRYTWHDAYGELRMQLDTIGRALGGRYEVLVDENHHVDREAGARSGVGFYGKNTMLITRRHGSWVVLGTLVTAAELEPTPPLDAGCGSCTRCVDACPTGALDEPGVLDATRCLSYWTQVPEPIPVAYRELLETQVYGCDICQDVCPWNRGVEGRRADLAPDEGSHIDLLSWLADTPLDEELGRRLYVPRNDPRWLKRNAIVALGNDVASPAARLALTEHANGDDEMLAEHARWALAQRAVRNVETRDAEAPCS